MHLLYYDSSGELCITRDLADDDIPPYAILSHTWGKDEEEVTFQDIGSKSGKTKAGYAKIEFCGRQAKRDGWQHFWVDTCCIDKANHTALHRAITSMYRWYQNAQVCYVYLADVPSEPGNHHGHCSNRHWETKFRESRWFTRGWTLQELLAPKVVVFYSNDSECLGTKSELKELLLEITGIPALALDGQPLSQFPIIVRMRWTQGRKTKEKEDLAYCLLGIFDVYIYLNYGEGDNAFRRLQTEIDIRSGGKSTLHSHERPSDVRNEIRSLGLCLASAPLLPLDDFVGRRAEMAEIRSILQSDRTASEQRQVVIGGIGGIGKTQLAITYARRHPRNYTSVFWLNATSEATLYTSFRSIAELLMTAKELESYDNKQILVRVREWLSQPYNTQWLLIFDNYDDPELFELNSFYPNVGYGSVIVTTRLPDMLTGSKIRLSCLKEIEEGLEILQLRSGRQGVKHDAGARRLAERLAGLPLALTTAGAYLRRTSITFQQYLEAYEERWQVDRRRSLPLREYQDRTLYTTWTLSYTRLETGDAEAAAMLKLLAYFDNQAIWYELFKAGLPNSPPEWLPLCLYDQVDFESLMGLLVDYCLVEVQHPSNSCTTYSMHNCVHDWTLGVLNSEVNMQLYWYSFDCVAASIDKTDWGALGQVRYNRISRHGVRLVHHRFKSCYESDSSLLSRLREAVWIARMLQEQGQLSTAERTYLRALAGYERALGPDHTSTLITVNNIGVLFKVQGKLEEAEQMYLRALAGRERALGPDHTSTLDTVNNIGVLFKVQGKLEEAKLNLQCVLAGRRKVLGVDHPDTKAVLRELDMIALLERESVDESNTTARLIN